MVSREEMLTKIQEVACAFFLSCRPVVLTMVDLAV